MSIQSKRLRDAYNLESISISTFATEIIIDFTTKDSKEHSIILDSRDCDSTSIEGYWIWVYKQVDVEIQPYLI